MSLTNGLIRIGEKILVPVAGNGGDEKALLLAGELAKANKAYVEALYVIEVDHALPLDVELAQETARAERLLRDLERLGREMKCPLEATMLQARDAGPAVVRAAVEGKCNMIVLHMAYKRQFGAFTLGQSIPYILENAPCQVLLCRDAMGAEAGNGSA
ncbi:MAG: universal stress protein [Chloroflexota bacterium]|nr:universal stress protein [Chloroflexota bacterium]MDE2942208.1 universal stress protein [Chloroflexota bacterium]MDE3267676.1 universal stress protein [Chloroflexota bacterium]